MDHEHEAERKEALDRERHGILQQIDRWLDGPMLVLGVVWTLLLVVELVQGLSPLLEGLEFAIWIIFALEFALEFGLAPHKSEYLRREWVNVVAVVAPGLRVVRLLRLARVARVARLTRGVRLLNVFSSINRGMEALGHNLGRRGFGYMVGLSLLIVMVGAAGMYAFERDAPNGSGFDSYETALWWTAMLLTTMGSESPRNLLTLRSITSDEESRKRTLPHSYAIPSSFARVASRGSAVHNFRRPTSADASRCASIQPTPRPCRRRSRTNATTSP